MAVATSTSTPVHRRLNRYRQVVDVLARHGLGFLIATHGPERLLAAPTHLRGKAKGRRKNEAKSASGGRKLTRPEHVRAAIEELGPTFIKLGQILSTRGDLLPQAYLDELAKLQDSAPPVPAEAMRKVLEEELGTPVEEAFATFEMTPLASASIGQAHAATLLDGTDVVVKLRRPGVVEQV